MPKEGREVVGEEREVEAKWDIASEAEFCYSRP
jgi:hypothetical protein